MHSCDLALSPSEKKSRHPFHIVLVEPEIPPNTGNIARLCVGTGSVLHLVGRLGFSIDDRAVRRAGLDYWKYLDLKRHEDLESLKNLYHNARFFYFSKTGRVPYTNARYREEDFLVFGSETRGLPKGVIEANRDALYRVPTTGNVRSLNLSNTCAVVLYEAIRQVGLIGG